MDKRQWKEISVASGEVWDRKEPIEGTFIRTDSNVGPNQSKMHFLKTEEGEVGLWGSTVLDDKLTGVYEGAYIKVEYEGELTGKRGTKYHSFKVFIDENTEPSGYEKAKAQAAKLKGEDIDEDKEDEPTPEMPPDFLQDDND